MSLLVHVMFYPFCVRFLSLYCIHCLFSLFTCSFVTCEIQYQSINQSINHLHRTWSWTSFERRSVHSADTTTRVRRRLRYSVVLAARRRRPLESRRRRPSSSSSSSSITDHRTASGASRQRDRRCTASPAALPISRRRNTRAGFARLYYYTHTRLTALCTGLLGWSGTNC